MATKKKPSKKITRIVYPKSFDSKKYPDFIRKSIFLKAFPKPEKIFPKIGLENCEVSLSSIKVSNKAILTDYLQNLVQALDSISSFNSELSSGAEERFYSDIVNLYDDLESYSCCDSNANELLVKVNDEYQLMIPTGLELKTIKADKNTKLTDVVRHLIKEGKKLKIDVKPLEKLSIKKNMTASKLLGKKNLSICFSSEGDKGYWDIATMSMRKITSCMRWKSSHATSLVGSIVDPYAGIIYLTDGEYTKYGKNMLARAVVRFVVNRNNNKPAILIEEIYYNGSYSNVDKYSKIFTSFIESRVKIPVLDSDPDSDLDHIYNHRIPMSEPTEAIYEIDCESGYLSYRDSEIDYTKFKKFYDPKKIKGLDKLKIA